MAGRVARHVAECRLHGTRQETNGKGERMRDGRKGSAPAFARQTRQTEREAHAGTIHVGTVFEERERERERNP